MKKIIKISLWMLAFIPLIVDGTIFTPANSNFYMRSLLTIASMLFLIQFLLSKIFRNTIIEKTKKNIKNPLVISLFSFVIIYIISTIFATDKYSAFWGTIERTEGLAGMMYFFYFFVISLMIFEKKDWIWFFKLSLLTTTVLLFKEFIDLFNRAGFNSLVGNSAFLAGYLLFSIFCAIIVFNEAIPLEITRARSGRPSLMGWKYFSVIVFILSIFGIILTGNRGSMLGLFLTFCAILFYLIFKGKNLSYKKFNIRHFSIIILCIIFVFSTIFISTRKSLLWQKVPGLNRIALIGNNDDTTQTRLLMSKLSFKAVDPRESGIKKFLIGWGPENFNLAYGRYFEPIQFKYEMRWFNRSHNDFLDKLVMTGIFGLLAYLSIYFFFFRYIFVKKASLINVAFLYIGVSFFVYLLFIFNQITTFIPFFAVFAFIVYLNINDNESKEIQKNKQIIATETKPNIIFTYLFFSILTAFICFIYFRNDLPAYIQIREYSSLRKDSNAKVMSNEINKVFTPFTTAQTKIRYDFLFLMTNSYVPENQDVVNLSKISFFEAEEYMKKVPYDLPFMSILSYNYTNYGKNFNDIIYLKRGEEYLRKVLLFAPNRPDFNYVLAINLYSQNRYDEAFDQVEKTFDMSPEYFIDNKTEKAELFYSLFIKHFYNVRDKDNFIRAAKRLRDNNYYDSSTLDKIIEYVQKNNIWPNINFH